MLLFSVRAVFTPSVASCCRWSTGWRWQWCRAVGVGDSLSIEVSVKMEEMLDLERVWDIGDTLGVCVVLTQWQRRRKIVSTIDHATTFLGYDVMPPVQGVDDRVVSDGIIAPCGRYGGLLDIDFYLTLEIVSYHFLAKPNLTAINTKQLSQWRFTVRKSFYCNV